MGHHVQSCLGQQIGLGWLCLHIYFSVTWPGSFLPFVNSWGHFCECLCTLWLSLPLFSFLMISVSHTYSTLSAPSEPVEKFSSTHETVNWLCSLFFAFFYTFAFQSLLNSSKGHGFLAQDELFSWGPCSMPGNSSMGQNCCVCVCVFMYVFRRLNH